MNFKDFAILAQTWYKIQGHPDIRPMVSGDVNNLSGNVDVNIVNFGPGAWRAFVLMDGQFMGEIWDFAQGYSSLLETPALRNGEHNIKAVTVDYSGLVTVSDKVEVNFANDLYCVSGAASFEEGRDYQIAAMYSDANNLRVKLVDWDGTEIYTSPTTSGGINLAIPANAFTRQIYDLVIEKQVGDWESIWNRGIGKGYNLNKSYKFAIFLPVARFWPDPRDKDCRKRAVAEIISACENRGISYVILYKGACNWENFRKVLNGSTTSYAYMVADGGTRVFPGSWTGPSVQRTYFNLSDKSVLSYWSSDLPRSWHYMEDLGLGDSTKMRIVFIDGCRVAEYPDMASEWINYNQVALDQLFISWQGAALTNEYWDMWSRDIWRALGRDSQVTYLTALGEAQKDTENIHRDYISGKSQIYGYDQTTFTNRGNTAGD